ncbi:uncharacterized protein LOC124914078 [Impatiens glandulifera]|uniref:uncharacterized protein LOC124914078 n=1 Tax=Impatiens glandulifera TaxID=253017 RepID=UPI001FB0E826|nr:uncharacterized protein LOC124914078 [Impatiens glandulifera]
MPLFEIAAAQPSLHSRIFSSRVESLLHGKFVIGDDKSFGSPRKHLVRFAEKENYFSFSLVSKNTTLTTVVRAVTTIDPDSSAQKDDNTSAAAQIDEPEVELELDERERLRRMRISNANKGNTPWNKGRKHSPETLQRIKEKTRLAMQNPKVKMKLINISHSQSDETRAKIGIGVRIGWEKRREKQMLQETCHFEWQNLIAEASRRGFVGEGELQWDAYKTLDEQLQQEWLESVEKRRKAMKPAGSKRAPKSADQKKKISEAIFAKWADPEYRNRVCSALAKYHGTADGAERKPRRRPVRDGQTGIRTAKRKIKDTENSEKRVSSKPRLRSKMPVYKDPLASSKLEMIKQIRAQRVAKEAKKTDAIERAKQLIAEAEKAVEALEVAATRNPLAQASLIEARELIAEATRSIENVVNDSLGNEKQVNGNGVHSVMPDESSNVKDLDFTNFSFHDFINGKEKAVTENTTYYNLPNALEELYEADSNGYGLPSVDLDSLLNGSSIRKNLSQLEPNIRENGPKPNGIKLQHQIENQTPPSMEKVVTKKWVCGRLIQVQEGT